MRRHLTPVRASAQTGFVYGLVETSYPLDTPNQLHGFTADTMTLLPGDPKPIAPHGQNVFYLRSPETLAYDASLHRLYALNVGATTVSAFSDDTATGATTPLPFSPIVLPVFANCIAINPGGSVLAAGD